MRPPPRSRCPPDPTHHEESSMTPLAHEIYRQLLRQLRTGKTSITYGELVEHEHEAAMLDRPDRWLQGSPRTCSDCASSASVRSPPAGRRLPTPYRHCTDTVPERLARPRDRPPATARGRWFDRGARTARFRLAVDRNRRRTSRPEPPRLRIRYRTPSWQHRRVLPACRTPRRTWCPLEDAPCSAGTARASAG